MAAILDFLHLLVHLYAAARLAYSGNPKTAWELYERMLRDAWDGKVQTVIDTLASQVRRLRAIGLPAGQWREPSSTGKDACRVVELAWLMWNGIGNGWTIRVTGGWGFRSAVRW